MKRIYLDDELRVKELVLGLYEFSRKGAYLDVVLEKTRLLAEIRSLLSPRLARKCIYLDELVNHALD